MKGSVLAYHENQVEYLKFNGVVRYSNCGGLEKHIEGIFSSNKVSALLVDLEDAEILDSTALGMLAKLAIELKKQTTRRGILFMSRGELERIVRRICFDQIFYLLRTDSSPFADISVAQSHSSCLEKEELLKFENLHKAMRARAKKEPKLFTDISNYAEG